MTAIKTNDLQDYSLTKDDLNYFKNLWPNMAKAWNNGDREPYIIAHKDSIYMVPHSQTLSDPDEIRSFVEGFPENKSQFFDFDIRGNQKLVAVSAKFVLHDMDNKLMDQGKFIALFEKAATEKWSMTHAIWNSDLPVAN